MDPYYRMKLCRICFKSKDTLKEIFSEDIEAQKLVTDAFLDILEDNVSNADLLPQNVCHECLAMLISFKFFKENCIKSRKDFEAELRDPKNWISGSRNSSKSMTFVLAEPTEEEIVPPEPNAELEPLPAEDIVDEELRQSEEGVPDDKDDSSKDIDDHPNVFSSEEKNVHREDTDEDSASSASQSDSEERLNTETNEQHTVMKQLVSDDGLFMCRICDKGFKYRNFLRAHYKEHEALMPYKCPYCDRGFMELMSLNNHIVLHSDYKPFECEICGLKVRHKSTLLMHKRSHSENKETFLCWQCGNVYGSRVLLNRHILLHHRGIKPFCCVECNMEFGTAGRYRLHMNRHTGMKLFLCQICGKDFPEKSKLKSHQISVHSDVKSEVCHLCGKRFALRKYLRYHVRMVHEKHYRAPRKRNRSQKND